MFWSPSAQVLLSHSSSSLIASFFEALQYYLPNSKALFWLTLIRHSTLDLFLIPLSLSIISFPLPTKVSLPHSNHIIFIYVNVPSWSPRTIKWVAVVSCNVILHFYCDPVVEFDWIRLGNGINVIIIITATPQPLSCRCLVEDCSIKDEWLIINRQQSVRESNEPRT